MMTAYYRERITVFMNVWQGFQRTSDQGWPDGLLLVNKNGTLRPTANPDNYMWVLTIPQAEFDGNINMTVDKDQNPAGDE